MGGKQTEELVYLKNNEAVCDSLQVAERFGKRHGDVIRAISNQRKNALVESRKLYRPSEYIDAKGETRPMYLMNRQGFELLVMGFNGEKALRWKLAYSDAFYKMESFIVEKSTQSWIDTRKAGKLTRQAETDTIKNLVEYARQQGSTHSDKLYMTYSKLANKIAGVSDRDKATVMQLNNLSLIEHIILNVIDSGIIEGKHYKEIYRDCKNRLQTFKDLAYLECSHG